MDRLSAMQVFVRVAELSSFSAVAHQMGVARSIVTRQIAALEQHLGVKLMARSTRRLTLTAAGAAYLEKCRVILNLVEAAETGIAEQRQTARGPIRISLPLSYGLKRVLPVLLAFARDYPEVSIDMDYTDRRVNLIEEGFDLAIRITAQPGPTEVARKLGRITMQTLASPDYLARFGRPLHPAELSQHECLAYNSPGTSSSWTYRVDNQWKSFSVPSRISAGNGEALTEAAAQGLGITVQPDFVAEPYLAVGRVVPLLEAFDLPELGLYAILPGNRQVPHRVRVLIDFLATQL
ncbi:MAG: LysR family transcriptional regulator [Betaproteobacteria bacterium]|nr:LysR family transcriptional regulator [Betaproteobacteria bacterium]